MAKLVDAPDLGSGGLRRVGSSPIRRTLVNVKWLIISYLTFLFCKNWRNFGVLIVTLCIITFFFVMMIVHQLKV